MRPAAEARAGAPLRQSGDLAQTLGWTSPKPREPEAADRWTWLIITAYTQLRLARSLTRDLRHPWDPWDPEQTPGTPLRRGQNSPPGEDPYRPTAIERLKNKLVAGAQTVATTVLRDPRSSDLAGRGP